MDGVVFLINGVRPAESGFSFMLSERFIPQGLGKVQAEVCNSARLNDDGFETKGGRNRTGHL